MEQDDGKQRKESDMEFIVSISFRAEDLAEMAPHLPQERARVDELREQGVVKALYVSTDRLSVWLVMHGESQEQVQKDLESLPLHPYMREVGIVPLAVVS